MVQTPSPLPTSHCINYRCAAISDLRNVVDGLLRDASPGKPRRGWVACACRERQSTSIRAPRAQGQARAFFLLSVF